MAMPTNAALPPARGESRTRTALVLESFALRHQIAVLERSGTRRPCFRFWDRLFWILFSRWWPQWRDSLIMVQPETVLRWRREGWSALWRYRSHGRWRGGRPRVSREVRLLIVRMARENFLWGAPRIHGELLMLGFSLSQATVSRYLPARSRRPGQSWRTFLRNQAMAFGHYEYAEKRSRADAGLCGRSCWAQLERSGAAQIATLRVGLRRGLGRQQRTLNGVGIISPRSAHCDRGVTHRAAFMSVAQRERYITVSGMLFRYEVRHRLGHHHGRSSGEPYARAPDQVLRNHRLGFEELQAECMPRSAKQRLHSGAQQRNEQIRRL